MTSDQWISAALDLRKTILNHEAVVRVAERAPYETRGRKKVVRGIALQDRGKVVAARCGVVLNLQDVVDMTIESLAREIKSDMNATWSDYRTGRKIVIYLDVLDLAGK